MEIEVHSELSESDLSEWQRFLSQSEHQHPRQDPRYANVERATGNKVYFVIGRKSRVIEAVGLFCLKPHPFLPGFFSEALCLSGPICNNLPSIISFLEKIRAHSAFTKAGRMKVTPYWTGEAAEKLSDALKASGGLVSEGAAFRETGWVDLSRDSDAILAGFSKSARREVRRAERQGVEVRMIEEESRAREFLHSLNCLRHSRALPMLNKESFSAAFWDIYCSGDMGVLLGAYQNDDLIGGLMLLRSQHTAHTPHFTTMPDRLRSLSNLRVAPFVWLEGMLWAKQKGCLRLDVEGWKPSPEVTDKKYNIYKYKGEFHPTPVLRISEYMFPLNKFIHDMEQIPRKTKQLVKSLRSLRKNS
ncbi:GNAT family N-acetyltransferase [Kordiimonas sp.]|uniref:GNAT family N-acetyltransferase n=1 Tax=Kordiimonas sp. TaxID=1970157 RepID=UPI003A8F34D5